MSGHSHWAGIKHKKAINDAKRGKVFSKVARLITIAAREGADPEMNAKLRLAVQKAKDVSMPKDNIERAISKGAGSDAEALMELLYEGYAAGGVAFIAEALTDNGNRTTPEIRKLIDAAGAKLGKPGCVAYMFKQKGVFSIKKDGVDMDELMMTVLDAGAEDVTDEGDVYEIVCDADQFAAVRQALDDSGYEPDVAELIRIADNEVDVDPDTFEKVMSLVERLEDHDDIQNVYTSAKITAGQIAGLESKD